MHELIIVEVGGDSGNGTCRYQTIGFTGRLIQVSSESRYTTTTLYEWSDRGYLVHVDEDRPRGLPLRNLHPWPAEATPRVGYTAEEIIQAYPEFANEVGARPDRESDSE